MASFLKQLTLAWSSTIHRPRQCCLCRNLTVFPQKRHTTWLLSTDWFFLLRVVHRPVSSSLLITLDSTVCDCSSVIDRITYSLDLTSDMSRLSNSHCCSSWFQSKSVPSSSNFSAKCFASSSSILRPLMHRSQPVASTWSIHGQQ